MDRSALPVSGAFPNGVKFSGLRRSFSGAMVNDVSSDCGRYYIIVGIVGKVLEIL